MISGLILDIDGVLVGGKPGFNFPFPNEYVINALQSILNRGIHISLCTAKPAFTVTELVSLIGLQDVYVSNGGSEIFYPQENKIIAAHELDNSQCIKLINLFNKNNLYSEAYTPESWAIEKIKYTHLTDININILGTKPILVSSLPRFINNKQIVKIMPAAYDKQQFNLITELLKDFPDFHLSWGSNPMYDPILYGVVTKKGITKKSGALEISTYTGVSLENMLGIGDGMSDWEFMQLCGHVGTVANADPRVIEFVKEKNGVVGKSVDENGILDVFKNYKLI